MNNRRNQRNRRNQGNRRQPVQPIVAQPQVNNLGWMMDRAHREERNVGNALLLFYGQFRGVRIAQQQPIVQGLIQAQPLAVLQQVSGWIRRILTRRRIQANQNGGANNGHQHQLICWQTLATMVNNQIRILGNIIPQPVAVV